MSRVPDLMAKVSLLRTAEEVFAEHGLEDAKVEEISRRAGVSKGAFYLHFASKQEAFKQVVEGFLARFTAMILPPDAHSQVPTTAHETLDFVLQQDLLLFEFLWQNRDIVRIVDGCHGEFAYMLEGFNRTMVDASKKWIDYWQKARMMRREVDPNVAAILLHGAYGGLAHAMMTEKHRPPLEAWLEQASTTFFIGMGTAPMIQAGLARQRRWKNSLSKVLVTGRPLTRANGAKAPRRRKRVPL